MKWLSKNQDWILIINVFMFVNKLAYNPHITYILTAIEAQLSYSYLSDYTFCNSKINICSIENKLAFSPVYAHLNKLCFV